MVITYENPKRNQRKDLGNCCYRVRRFGTKNEKLNIHDGFSFLKWQAALVFPTSLHSIPVIPIPNHPNLEIPVFLSISFCLSLRLQSASCQLSQRSAWLSKKAQSVKYPFTNRILHTQGYIAATSGSSKAVQEKRRYKDVQRCTRCTKVGNYMLHHVTCRQMQVQVGPTCPLSSPLPSCEGPVFEMDHCQHQKQRPKAKTTAVHAETRSETANLLMTSFQKN